MIHQYKFDKLNIVLDVASGSIHLVDDIAYDVIALFEDAKKEEVVNKIYEKYKSESVSLKEVQNCYNQVLELKNNGTLFSEDKPRPRRQG